MGRTPTKPESSKKVPVARRLRGHALSIFKAALAASDPSAAVVRHLEGIDVSKFRDVYVVGAGKAAASMARAAERVLGKRIAAGSINTNPGQSVKLRRIELHECGHPVPDERGVEGARRIAQIAESAGKDDLVICLISGGASALMPLPAAPISLAEKQFVTRLLLACGADIREINKLRKHISDIKGGQLARLAAPAAVEALLVSDVIGDAIDIIGSGPAAPDALTFADAAEVLYKYRLMDQVPEAISERFARASLGEIPDTPKPGDPIFARVRNTLIGSNRLALRAAAKRARELGYRTLVLASEVEGETREIARMHAAIAKEIARSGQPVRPPPAS